MVDVTSGLNPVENFVILIEASLPQDKQEELCSKGSWLPLSTLGRTWTDIRIGRGFFTGDDNKRADTLLGVIPIDSIFSPVIRVKYSVENTRVGQRTDYDKLMFETWTDSAHCRMKQEATKRKTQSLPKFYDAQTALAPNSSTTRTKCPAVHGSASAIFPRHHFWKTSGWPGPRAPGV